MTLRTAPAGARKIGQDVRPSGLGNMRNARPTRFRTRMDRMDRMDKIKILFVG
jgi:hypothetical protein